MTKNDEDNKETLKFQSKSEIATCIQVLTPFTKAGGNNTEEDFAVQKIKELTKLL